MVPKNEVWIRKVSETKAIVPEGYRKAMAEVPGWYRKAMVGVPGCYREANGTEKRDLAVLEGYRKATLGVEGWLPESEILNAGRYLWTDPWI